MLGVGAMAHGDDMVPADKGVDLAIPISSFSRRAIFSTTKIWSS